MWSSAATAGVSPRPCGCRPPAAKPCSAPSPLAREEGAARCGLLLLDSFEIQIGGWKTNENLTPNNGAERHPKEESDMSKMPLERVLLARRRFLHACAAAAGVGAMPGLLVASTDPGATSARRPRIGDIRRLAVREDLPADCRPVRGGLGRQDRSDHRAQRGAQVAKLTAMYAAGDNVDVSQSPIQYLGSYIEQGIAEPIDGLPGVEGYVEDFTAFTRQIAVRDGKTWGLPYFSTVWTFMYNDELLNKAGFGDRPFTTYEELVEQCLKAKQGRGGEVPDPVGRGGRLRAASRHLVQHHPQSRRRHIRQGTRTPVRAGLRLHAKPCAGGRRPSPSTRSRTRIR